MGKRGQALFLLAFSECRAARDAAVADDDELLSRYVFEAFRFKLAAPAILRRAASDTMIARSNPRARKVPKGTMVIAASLSAMFDPMQLPEPNQFRIDRPWADCQLWGYGLHTCFGAHINRVVIPAVLKPLSRQNILRRAGAFPMPCQASAARSQVG